MKSKLKLATVLLVLVFAAVAGGSATARGGHGGGGHWGGGHGGYSHGGGHGHGFGYGVGLGIALSVPLYALGYYSNPYYSYPAYAYPEPAYSYPAPAVAASGAYTAQGYPQAQAAAPQQDWYFCPNSNAYYPYVRECPGGWQRVPSTPPR